LTALSPSFRNSVLIHMALVALFVLVALNPRRETYIVPIDVAVPSSPQALEEVKEKPKVALKTMNTPIPTAAPVREIFGASRNSHTDSSPGADGIDVKKGNTLAKASDSEKLKDTDADSLPTPTEEYLVSEMPSVLNEVKPVYPKEAREKQIEGKVALDVLIDDKGVVRQASVIEGPEIFRANALSAMKLFKFRPALVDGKSVAVRIRYTLNFELEY
jgi:TonB family protein